jgi:hypothetical protein
MKCSTSITRYKHYFQQLLGLVNWRHRLGENSTSTQMCHCEFVMDSHQATILYKHTALSPVLTRWLLSVSVAQWWRLRPVGFDGPSRTWPPKWCFFFKKKGVVALPLLLCCKLNIGTVETDRLCICWIWISLFTILFIGYGYIYLNILGH